MVSAVLLGRHRISVLETPIWAQLGSKNVHQADSSLNNPLQGERGKSCSLSRRLFGAGAQQIRAQTAHRFRVTDTEGGRLPDEPEEMPFRPAVGVRVPRTPLGYPSSQGFLTRGQESGFHAAGTQLTGESQPGHSSKISGKGDLRMESSSSGKATLASFPDVSHQRPEVRPVTDESRCRERSQMVDPATYRRFESEGPFGRPVNDDGRFYSRMGCDVGPQVGQRSLVQEGDGSPYKPSGVTGGLEGSTKFYPDVEEQSSDCALGQRDSSGVPDERWRYKIKSSERVDKGDPAVLQETQGDDCTSLE